MNRLISPLLLILLLCNYPRMGFSMENLYDSNSLSIESIYQMQQEYGATDIRIDIYTDKIPPDIFKPQNFSPIGNSIHQPPNTTALLPTEIWIIIWEHLDNAGKLHLGTLSKIISSVLKPNIHLYFAELRLQLLFENIKCQPKDWSEKFQDLVTITKAVHEISKNSLTPEYTLKSTSIIETYKNQVRHFLDKYADSFGENIEIYWVVKHTADYNFLCKVYNFQGREKDPLELAGLTALCCVRYSFIGGGILCMAPFFLACSPIIGVTYLCIKCNEASEKSHDEAVETI